MSFRSIFAVLALAVVPAALAQTPPPATQAGQAQQQARPAAPAVAVDKNKVSYAIGYEIGRDFIDKKMDVDINQVIRALQD
ncbi:MAG: FKBP-type peptidyl-prolyl cis-trans isomerase N-terminal domain-containing protein, partial [Pseudomonadales bacterium]|nr:FKBP-type peptidyl-prolyl cis-trans isomerase N-terminal domain-containing protein [Pseudomonadales bacterium]